MTHLLHLYSPLLCTLIRLFGTVLEAFRERATRDHLLDILTNVNKRVGEMVETQPALENKTEIKDLK